MQEEKAELKASNYLLLNEKAALELKLSGKESQEKAYLVTIEHLKSEVSDRISGESGGEDKELGKGEQIVPNAAKVNVIGFMVWSHVRTIPLKWRNKIWMDLCIISFKLNSLHVHSVGKVIFLTRVFMHIFNPGSRL